MSNEDYEEIQRLAKEYAESCWIKSVQAATTLAFMAGYHKALDRTDDKMKEVEAKLGREHYRSDALIEKLEQIIEADQSSHDLLCASIAEEAIYNYKQSLDKNL